MGKDNKGGNNSREETRQAHLRQSLPPEGGGVIGAVAEMGPEGLERGSRRAEVRMNDTEFSSPVRIFPKLPEPHNFTQ